MRAARWLAAFRGKGLREASALVASLTWEADGGSLVERAAEPLWRGRTVLGPRSLGIGLMYDQADIVRAFAHDAWSERAASGRLRPHRAGALRRWRDVEAFARHWDRHGPRRRDDGLLAHGEVFLRKGATPIAVVVAPGAPQWAVDAARAWAEGRGLPLRGVEIVGIDQ